MLTNNLYFFYFKKNQCKGIANIKLDIGCILKYKNFEKNHFYHSTALLLFVEAGSRVTKFLKLDGFHL